jgi:putative sterol carrier protein
MSAYDVDPATMEPRQFARLVKDTPNAELQEIMRGDHRTLYLDGIFTRMVTLFRPDRAGSLDAVIHWNIGDRPGGGADTYEIVIADGTCILSEEPGDKPRLALSVGSMDFLKLISGNAHPIAMFMMGKMKATGDIPLATKIPSLFDIPKP